MNYADKLPGILGSNPTTNNNNPSVLHQFPFHVLKKITENILYHFTNPLAAEVLIKLGSDNLSI